MKWKQVVCYVLAIILSTQIFAQEIDPITNEEAQTFVEDYLKDCKYSEYYNDVDKYFDIIQDEEGFYLLNVSPYQYKIKAVNAPWVEVLASIDNAQKWDRILHFKLKKKEGRLYIVPNRINYWLGHNTLAHHQEQEIAQDFSDADFELFRARLLEYKGIKEENINKNHALFIGDWLRGNCPVCEEYLSRNFIRDSKKYHFKPNGQFDKGGEWFVYEDKLYIRFPNTGEDFAEFNYELLRDSSLWLSGTYWNSTIGMQLKRKNENQGKSSQDAILHSLNPFAEVLLQPIYNDLRIENPNQIVFEVNARKGLMDTLGQAILPAIYEKITFSTGGDSIFAAKEGSTYVLDNKGQELNILDFDLGMAWVKKQFFIHRDTKAGIMDAQTNVIIEPVYDVLKPAGFSAYSVCLDNKWGILDLEGKEILPLEYEGLEFRTEQLSIVQKGRHYGVVNNERKALILPIIYDRIVIKGAPLILAYKADKAIPFRLDGSRLSNEEYDHMEWIGWYYTGVEKDGKRGVIDEIGETVLPIKYDNILSADLSVKGLFNVKLGDKEFTVDSTGMPIVKAERERLKNTSLQQNNYSIAYTQPYQKLRNEQNGDHYAFYAPNGQMVIPPVYEGYPILLKENKIITKQRGKMGIINETQDVLLPFIFEEVEETLLQDVFVVKYQEKKGLIRLLDRKGITASEFTSFIDELLPSLLFEERADWRARIAPFFDESTKQRILNTDNRIESYHAYVPVMRLANTIQVFASSRTSNELNTWLDFEFIKEYGKVVLKGKVEKDWTFPSISPWQNSGSLESASVGIVNEDLLEEYLRSYLKQHFEKVKPIYDSTDFVGDWVMDSTYIVRKGSDKKEYTNYVDKLGRYSFFQDEDFLYSPFYSFIDRNPQNEFGRWFIQDDVLAFLNGLSNEFEYYFIEEKGEDYFKAYTLMEGDTIGCKFIPYTATIFEELDAEETNTTFSRESVDLDSLGLNIVAAPKYDNIQVFNAQFLRAEQNKQKGLLDKNGQIVVPISYDKFIFNKSNKQITAKKNNQWYQINKVGIATSLSKPTARDTSNSLFDQSGWLIAEKDEKVGLIDSKGDTVISFIYDVLSPIYTEYSIKEGKTKEGVFTIQSPINREVIAYTTTLDRRGGIVLTDGTTILEPIYHHLDAFSYPFITASNTDSYNTKGLFHAEKKEWILSFEYDFIFVGKKYIKAKKDGIEYLFQLDGTPISLPTADLRYYFWDGLLGVEREDKRGVVNFEDDILIPLAFSEIEKIKNDTFQVKQDGKWGIYSVKNGEMIPPLYDELYSLTSMMDNMPSLAPLAYRIGTKKGLLNWEGVQITPALYEEIGGHNQNTDLLKVKLNDKYGLINSKGEYVVEAKYDNISFEQSGFYPVELQGRTGLINSKGEVILPTVFDELSVLPDNEWNIFDDKQKVVMFKLDGKWGILDLEE